MLSKFKNWKNGSLFLIIIRVDVSIPFIVSVFLNIRKSVLELGAESYYDSKEIGYWERGFSLIIQIKIWENREKQICFDKRF